MRDDLAEAEKRLTSAVARDRKCRDAHDLLAEVSYRRDDFETAAGHLEAAGRRPVAAKLRSLAGRQPYAIEGPETVRLPFVTMDPLPILKARLNGGPELSFLLDTGGSELIVDATHAQTAGIPTFGRESGHFAGGKSAAIVQGAADSLDLGDIRVRNLPVQIMDLRAIGVALGEPELAGVVGTVLLYRLRATIDYPGGALVLRRKQSPADAPGAGAIEVPFWMADDHFILAEGSLDDGPPLLFFVDSGLGGGAFTCPASTLQEAGIDLRSAPHGEGPGGGGSVGLRPFEVASLSLGGARREQLIGIAGPFPPQLEWEYGFRIGGLISHEFLRAYAVTFDFQRMSMRLEPGPA
jgi:hypothetical protein